MKRLLIICSLTVAGLWCLSACDNDKKQEQSTPDIQSMIDDAVDAKVKEMKKDARKKRKQQREQEQKEQQEAEQAMQRKMEREYVPPRTEVRRVPDVVIPGARMAHVIREGGATNARTGPGTDYPVLNQVVDGSPILYVGSLTRDRWVEVYTTEGDYLGYMSTRKIVP